jgi:hypothetical protein
MTLWSAKLCDLSCFWLAMMPAGGFLTFLELEVMLPSFPVFVWADVRPPSCSVSLFVDEEE